jgi:alpha-L-arabinofuranosidase
MTHVTRRELLAGTVAAVATAALAPRLAAATDSRVEVLLDEPIGRIAPEIYGHFVEHLGGVVYDGIWVGENSPVPNDGGIRRAIVEHMRRIKASVIRWPGGCFADSYDWRDGIGPRNERPTRTNFWVDERVPDGPQKYDPNSFGTNEFLRFCQLCGAQPYLAANLRSLPALAFSHWVEYANAPAGSTTLARQRGGEPFNVRFWGVGNESWGCGGNFTPDEYATEFRRFVAWVPNYGTPPAFIAAGPSSGELEWTRGFFEALVRRSRGLINSVWGWGLHHYSWNVSQGRTTDWVKGKGDAVDFPVEEWYELLREGDKMEGLITRHWSALGEFDPAHRVKFAVDEWGSWYRPGTELRPSHQLGQQNTIRDALLAGLTLDIFHRHAEKVAMSNIAQLVNCLQALFLADGDRFIVTPTYHVFEMYAAHQGGESVRTVVSAPRVSHLRAGEPTTIWGLEGSASRTGNRVIVTMVNPSATDARPAEILVRGGTVTGAQWTSVGSTQLNAHNTFDAPTQVQPTSGAAQVTAGRVAHTFPPASVTKIELVLA